MLLLVVQIKLKVEKFFSFSMQWHLLEHAFDMILEAGEIPPLSFFLEMVCQATSQQDYKRAVRIINTMAHAPYIVGEQQWIEFFEMNEGRITRDYLKELLDTLMSRDLVKESTVLSLSRALQVLCGSCDAKESSIGSGFNTHRILPVVEDDAVGMACNDTVREENGRQIVSGSSNISREKDGAARLTGLIENSDCDLGSSTTVSFYVQREADGVEYGFLDNEFEKLDFHPDISSDESDDSQDESIPSAHEILETWKEMKKRNASF